jgi:predicted lipid carrier protein YhbT
VHRYDAETAAGTPTPVDAELAVDGIDEFLTVFVPRMGANFGPVGDATVHVHCTDVDGEWLVACNDGEVAVTREHAKGDVAARGTASDLLLFLWGRVSADTLEVFGDADLLGRFGQAIKV